MINFINSLNLRLKIRDLKNKDVHEFIYDLLPLYIKNMLESRVIGNYVTVEDGKEVREMGQLNGRVYALTENKVGSVNCAKYTTCEECNEKAGIPACGWSILSERCQYNRGQLKISNNICSGINSYQEHTDQYPFQLLANVNGSYRVVAKTLFWTYDCNKFETCNECVRYFDKRITCFWCKEKATCKQNTDDCKGGNSINNTGTCPSLNKSEVIRIPYNIMENKTFLGTNIPKKNQSVHNFQCNINGKNFSVSEVNTDSITCQDLKVQMPSPLKQNVTVTVTVYFRHRILDTTDIEVYSCEILGRDCSTCKYFKAENYSCNWCNSSNQCQYNKECPASTECPAPQITNISPENGTLGGNTKVVIEGRNLGVNDDSITHLSLAEKNCLRHTKIDFQKLECITSSSATESNGPDPSLSSISPDTIIKEGGVWLTISGRNLNVGNQKYVKGQLHYMFGR
ncbi:hypothetical protein KUTeg_020351 [Tegillarca granosa]|uniref:PSI domain-containing protein n=1 Tax=Tegillarca granosa TaxID=220873 RepID=A0ABQ9EA87_TEGGR|nr:hypothetical protein KUTeg_020351 [Tegillarca granosa]